LSSSVFLPPPFVLPEEEEEEQEEEEGDQQLTVKAGNKREGALHEPPTWRVKYCRLSF